MPANPKYLTHSKWQRFAKVSAAILGGFMVASALHLVVGAFLPVKKNLLATFSFSLYIVWCALMCVAFLFENGWKCWLLYGAVTLVCAVIIYFKAFAI